MSEKAWEAPGIPSHEEPYPYSKDEVTAALQKRVEELERALREILADHDERVKLYGFDVQPNRLRVMGLARAALAAGRGE